MAATDARLKKLFEQKGFGEITVEKTGGQWLASFTNPLTGESEKSKPLGRSYVSAKAIVDGITAVPSLRESLHQELCTGCGSVEKQIRYTNSRHDYVSRCKSCAHEVVLQTAEESEAHAREISADAQGIIDPSLNAFVNGLISRNRK